MITDKQIERLANEAGQHGDLVQVALCRIALGCSISDIREGGEMVAVDALREWDHVWQSQIWGGALEVREDARKLARVLCERAIDHGADE